MKISQLIEAKYAGNNKPQYTGFSAEKVVQTFFEFDAEEEVDEDVFQKTFYPKEGLYITDDLTHTHEDPGNPVIWLVLRHGQWYSYVGRDELHVDPGKFSVDMKIPVYRP